MRIIGMDLGASAARVAAMAGGRPAALGAPLDSAGKTVTATLAELKRVAEAHLGAPVASAVVTVPALATVCDRQALIDAGRAAGLEVVRTVASPVAAAMAHGHSTRGSGTVAVVDLGRGALDLAVVSIDDGSYFEVLAMGREPDLNAAAYGCRVILGEAGLGVEEIAEVLVVGGASRAPHVEAAVREVFGREPSRRLRGEEASVLGVAVQAGVLGGEVTDVLLIDVLPLSLGIETEGGEFSRVIGRWGAIPTLGTEVFSTATDDQNSVDVTVHQGEGATVAENVAVASYRFSGIAPGPRGEPRIEVCFEIGADGLLTVSGKDLRDGRVLSVDPF